MKQHKKFKKIYKLTSTPSIELNLVRCMNDFLSTANHVPIHKTAEPTI